MANWKKIIVSGSNGHLANLDVDSLSSGVVTGAAGNLTTTAINGSGNILATTGATGIQATGAFTGSFSGDGSALTGLATNLTVGADTGNDDTVDLQNDVLEFTGGTNISATVSNNTITYNLGGSILSASAISAPSTQGQVQLTNNGAAQSAITVNSLGTTGTPTFGSITVTNDATVNGNLTVNGSLTTLSTTNTNIKDKFLLLNSGSATIGDESGIVFGGANGTSGNGVGLIWNGDYNSNDGRLAIANNVNSDATSAAVSYYVGGVFDGNATAAASAQADHRGNIRVDSSDDIWIYA